MRSSTSPSTRSTKKQFLFAQSKIIHYLCTAIRSFTRFMKQKLFLSLVALLIGAQMMATDLVLLKTDGTQQLQDIATIGKWVYVGEDLQLLSHDGVVLAQEPAMNIRKITFAESSDPDTPTSMENIQSTSIVVYPNPSQDVLIVSGIEAQALRVFDLQGRLVKAENGTRVHVSDLTEGTYLLQVGTQVVRFIKK